MKTLWRILFVFAVIFLVWLGLWATLRSAVVPNPLTVIGNLIAELQQGLLRHILQSFLRVLIATAIAVALGVPLGLLIGYSVRWRKVLTPFVYFSYPVPKLALLPIILVLFGLGEGSKLLMIFLIIFFPIVMDVSAAVRGLDGSMFDALHAFGIPSSKILMRAVAPGLVPPILNTLKITTGMGLSVLFFAENYGTRLGLGYYIMNSWQKMDYVDMYTGVLTLALLGLMIFLALDTAERRAARWK